MIEAAGISTVVLTPMPEFHRAVGIPRQVAVAFPFGRLLGDVGEVETQTQVLREALKWLEAAEQPGHTLHLSLTWPQSPKATHWHPPQMSPIVKHFIDEIKKTPV
jgi:hypothetical protein